MPSTGGRRELRLRGETPGSHRQTPMHRDAIPATVALRADAELGEGPVWHVSGSRLIWVDIIGRSVHFSDPATGDDTSVSVPGMPGVAIPRQGGGLVLAIGHGFGFLD